MTQAQPLGELARRSGENIGDLARWRDAGLVTDEVSAAEVERVRLIGALERQGVSLDAIAVLFRDHRHMIDDFVTRIASPTSANAGSLEQLLADIGIARDVAERVMTAGNLDDVWHAPTDDDLAAARTMRAVLDQGLPEDALMQMVRVYCDAMERVAETEIRLVHLHVHHALREQGVGDRELVDATATLSETLEHLVEPTLVYFHRKAWQRAVRRDLVIHALEELGIESSDSTRGEVTRAVLFADLSSFTPLTSVMGDVTAAKILDRFSTLVRATAHRHDGTVVKQIGDGFLIVFLDAASGVRAAAELHRLLCEEPQFPAMHAGIHYGPVLYREGDYLGATVNIAARLLTHADRHEIVLTAAARRRAGTLSEITFHPLGTHDIRGIEEPLELYRAENAEPTGSPRRTDPVCGMQLRDDEIAARMTVGDDEHVFCSTHCLQVYATRTSAPA